MRIAFVLPNFHTGGGPRVVAAQAQELAARGHEVVVIGASLYRPTLREELRSLVRDRRRASRPIENKEHFERPGVRVVTLAPNQSLVDCAALRGFDAVVATWWETAEWVASLPAEYGAKIYFVQHHEVHPGQPLERVRATYRSPLHKIAVSHWIAGVMRDEYQDSNVDVVENAVDPEFSSRERRELNRIPTVGYMYNPDASKGCDFIHRSIELARVALPELEAVAFSATHPDARLPLCARTRFRLLPSRTELAKLYASADLWLFASRSEGFGLPILEAMATGTPVVGVPAGAAPELLADGCGVLVPPENPRAMADAVVQVFRDGDSRWRAMSEKSRVRAQARSWRDAAAELESALERALKRA